MGIGTVYTGGFGNSRSELMAKEYIQMLSQDLGESVYFVLPNGELLRALRRRAINETGGAFNIGVMTFDDVVNRIISGESYKMIERPIQINILQTTMKRLAESGSLQVFHKMVDYEGFAGCVLDMITEAKRALISPEGFSEKTSGDNYLEEVSLIYSDYEDFLRINDLVDREGSYIAAVKLLDENISDFQGLRRIFIDQFYDFRPVELAILEKLMEREIHITINIPFGEPDSTSILQGTIDMLKNLGFEIIHDKEIHGELFEEFGESLISQKRNVDPEGGISLIRAENPELEVKMVINKIKRLLMGGVEPDQIQVVATSFWHRKLFLELAQEENLNVNSPVKKSLTDSKLVRSFMDLLKLRESGGSKEAIINVIKSPLLNRDGIDNELEIGIRRLKFKNLVELKMMIGSSEKLQINKKTLGKIYGLIDGIDILIKEEYEESNLCSHGRYALEMLDSLELQEYILEKSEALQSWKWLMSEMNSLSSFREVLQEITHMDYIDWELTFPDFMGILRDFTGQGEIITENPATNGVELLNPTNARALGRDYKFVIGMNKSQYPVLDEDNFLFSQKRMEILKSIGFKRLDYRERFENELLKLSSIVGSTGKHLYLGTSSSLEGEEDLPSIFLSRILRTSGSSEATVNIPQEIVDIDFYRNIDLHEISSNDDFQKFLLWRYYEKNLSEDSLKYFVAGNRELVEAINSRLQAEKSRAAEGFHKYSGVLTSGEILKIIDERLQNKVFSISYMEEYLKCPYAFLLGKLFGLEESPRKWQETKPIDKGQIYHRVLCTYYKTYKMDIGEDLEGFQTEPTRDNLREWVSMEAKTFGIGNESGGDRLFLKSIEETLWNYINADIERLKKSSIEVLPYSMEQEFGLDRSFSLSDGAREIYFRGVIDRIDRVEGESYILTDYKSSAFGKQTKGDIESGLSIQLPVYILSQMDKKVTGGYYGILSSGELYPSMAIKDRAPFVTGRNAGAVDEHEFERLLQISREAVFNAVDEIENGNFAVNPKKCSSYCIFRDICRFDKKGEAS